jgi:hypothetical protein
MRQITKIKARRNDDTEMVAITYAILNEDGEEQKTVTVRSKEEASESFYQALDSLRSILIDAVGLDADIWKEGFVTDFAIKDKEDLVAIGIGGKCEIQGRFVTVSAKDVLIEKSAYEYKIVSAVLVEASEYLDGERDGWKQPSLFTMESPGNSDEDEDEDGEAEEEKVAELAIGF